MNTVATTQKKKYMYQILDEVVKSPKREDIIKKLKEVKNEFGIKHLFAYAYDDNLEIINLYAEDLVKFFLNDGEGDYSFQEVFKVPPIKYELSTEEQLKKGVRYKILTPEIYEKLMAFRKQGSQDISQINWYPHTKVENILLQRFKDLLQDDYISYLVNYFVFRLQFNKNMKKSDGLLFVYALCKSKNEMRNDTIKFTDLYPKLDPMTVHEAIPELQLHLKNRIVMDALRSKVA